MFQKMLQGGSGGSSGIIDLAYADFSHDSNSGAKVVLHINDTTETVSLLNYNESGETSLFEVKRGTTTYTFTFLKEVCLYIYGDDSSKKNYGIGETYSYTGSDFSKAIMFAFIS